MKLNISFPATGCQKLIDIDDEKRVRMFYEKRMGQLVEADSLGEEWKGYVFRISGGNDKQGFPMKQGILTAGRVRLLLSKGHSCYRPRRNGERKRKSVRGCIVDQNLSVLALVVKKKGEQEIEGLTDKTLPRRLGPKRASKIRKLFNLTKQDDVRQYVIRKPTVTKEGKKERTKAPKIQRLITPLMLQHKRRRLAIKRARIEKRQEEEAGYARLLAQRAKEDKERRAEAARKRRSTRESQSSAGGDEAPVAKKAKAVAPKKAPVAAEKKPATPKVKKVAPEAPAKKPVTKKATPAAKAAPAEKKPTEKKSVDKKAPAAEKKVPAPEKKAAPAPAKTAEKSKPAAAKKGPAKKK